MTEADLWVRRFHPADDAETRLLCLSHAGGSASYFFGVSRALAPEIDVLAVQYPGRQDRLREPCLRSVHDLADALVPAIAELTDRPLAIFGHSLGATLGYEVARRLEQSGVIPTALFASGRPAPHRTRLERTHLRDDAGLLAAMKQLGGTEAALLDDEDVLAMVMPAIRGDYTAAETYTHRPGPKLSCPIFALTGADDPKATVAEVEAWREHTDAEFDLSVFPGGHFYLNDVVPDILAKLRAHARSVSSASPR